MAKMTNPGALRPLRSYSHLKQDAEKLKKGIVCSCNSIPELSCKLCPGRKILQSGSDSQALANPASFFGKTVRADGSLDALLKMGIRGVTVSDVRGFGAQGGSAERHGGSEFSGDKFLAKVKMEIVVRKEQVEAVVDKIIEEARTGEIVVPVSDVIRVRTGERGEKAERMVGGQSDVSTAA
ncbi:hypothetical protein SLEP1_g1533 [Rubroshorea leprosula]|uniref:Nitrogen regulatory protein P-II n=1 Tax=Rubroshorea leprosula TaxID=152421 RepID=A0AAV5HE31_9ROSI|nr:hypothetical protein SLEP1_g1533 [Rubroshorea leprosula]